MQDRLYQAFMEREGITLDSAPKNGGFCGLSTALPFTNEDYTKILSDIDFAGKDVLGVIGSLDFGLVALGQGARSFLGFDISLFACLFGELKHAGMMELDWEEYCQFFIPERPTTFDCPVKVDDKPAKSEFFNQLRYHDLRSHLSETAKEFFDGIIGKSFLAKDFKRYPLALNYMVGYVASVPRIGEHPTPFIRSEPLYKRIQEAVRDARKPVLMPGSLDEMLDPQLSMDVIYLSNVPDYVGKYGLKMDSNFMAKNKSILRPEGILVIYSMDYVSELDWEVPFFDLQSYNLSGCTMGSLHLYQKSAEKKKIKKLKFV